MTNDQTSSSGSTFQQDPFLRVKAEKVSQLLDLAGELGLVAAVVLHHPDLAGLELEGFQNDAHRLEGLIRDVQDIASSLRLVPVGQLFRRMQRTVHDLLRQTGKPAELVLEGDETELDKLLVDQMSDALVHLVRNAIDHGLESAEQRAQAGKAERGRLTLKASQAGREIHISVEDDGRGLDREAILRKARSSGLVGENEEPDDATVWSYIFHAGFSTASQVSNLSGRGVGMDVVQNTVQALRGRILVDTRPGQGTCITLVIPLTLAFLDALVVRARQRLYALPIEVVHEVFRPGAAQVVNSSADGSELVDWQGQLVPVERLQKVYGEQEGESRLTEQVVVVVNTRVGPHGLPVDEIIGQHQVVMKPLQGFMGAIRGGAGCALLGSGEVAIALDVDRLFQGGAHR